MSAWSLRAHLRPTADDMTETYPRLLPLIIIQPAAVQPPTLMSFISCTLAQLCLAGDTPHSSDARPSAGTRRAVLFLVFRAGQNTLQILGNFDVDFSSRYRRRLMLLNVPSSPPPPRAIVQEKPAVWAAERSYSSWPPRFLCCACSPTPLVLCQNHRAVT